MGLMNKNSKLKTILYLFIFINISASIFSQNANPLYPDFITPSMIDGMRLVWSDEFNYTGKPDSSTWGYETGFVRNQELQWYNSDNAYCINGVLLIEGRRERIDTSLGSWPAIWTLGIFKEWPSNGEIDIMEFYRVKGVPTILANFAWGTYERYTAKWDDLKKPLADFTTGDSAWTTKFHVWRMDWNRDSICLYLDDQLLNSTRIDQSVNPDGFNPFLQPHYILLNLAIGGNGGDPGKTSFPLKYEVDYVRVYQDE